MSIKTPDEAHPDILTTPCPITTLPNSLGKAVSVYDSSRHDPATLAQEKRSRYIMLAGGIALLLGLFVNFVVKPFPHQPWLSFAWPLLAALLSAWTVAINTIQKRDCNCATTLGAIQAHQQGLLPKVTQTLFQFEQAHYLTKFHTTHAVAQHYLYHAVEDETFHFRWMDDQHQQRYQIDGLNDHRNSFSVPLQNYYFGAAVELNWTRYLLRKNAAAIVQGLPIRCPLNESGSDYMELGAETFRYAIQGKIGEHGYEEVAESFRGEQDFDIGIFNLQEGGETHSHHWIKLPYPTIPNELFFMKLWELRTGTKVEVHHLLPEAKTCTTDPVTALNLSALFLQQLEQSITRHGRQDTTLAVVVIEVANIAFIKHALGREAGSLVLRTLANRMQASVRRGDTASRLWRDEFGITLTDLKPEALELVVEGIRAELAQPIDTPFGAAYAELHMGWAIYPEDGNHHGSLLRHARYQTYQNRIKAVLAQEPH
ncbi:diguanylate cyclase [Magnetococcus marinus MC-1]|uniref:Diguanylate cyclase n=1 Tax=Magnetococcus marinus (strain ATCC BAA-1437 / JCM 17883 / MC-1) TaxID=156889 RepID=A0L872_MAGMM|nr:GGDEF domain-containing protein [Magnetococcus marinus]ABK44165.1 diguanylate cyclase [Magnetococcus marinus MC-1]